MALNALYLAAVALHLLAAVAWVGGTVFLVVVLGPALRSTDLRPHASLLIKPLGRRFRTLTYIAFAVFLFTGGVLLAHRGFVFTPLLTFKLVLVACAFGISALHDFGVGPAAARPADAIAGARRRAVAAWLGRLNLVLTVAIVVLSVVIVRTD